MNIELQFEKLRAALIETQLTYTEIAKRAGINPKTVSRIAAGIETNPRIRTISAIDTALAEGESGP